MTLFKKPSICIVLFFLFLSLIPKKIYSQEIEIEPVDSTAVSDKYLHLFFNPVQNYEPIVYPDTVILNSPLLPIIFDGNHLDLNFPLTPELPFLKPLISPITISKHKLFADVHNKNALHRKTYTYLLNNNLKHIRYTKADFEGKAEKIEAMSSNVFQQIFTIDYDINKDNKAKPDRFYPNGDIGFTMEIIKFNFSKFIFRKTGIKVELKI